MECIIRLTRSPKILNEFLNKLDWPDCSVQEVTSQISELMIQTQQASFREVKDNENDNSSQSEIKENMIKLQLSDIIKAPKPWIVAASLGISRECIYSFRRKLRKEIKSKKPIVPQWTKNSKFNKAVALDLIRNFARENIHKFYFASDVKMMLQKSNQFEIVPSLSTIKRWMKIDLQLSFKKINVRFKNSWTPEDQLSKLKYIWIYLWLIREKHIIIYMDEFNSSDSSIKHYSWTTKGQQNYWFGNRKANKLNWIIAISSNTPHNIFIQRESMTAEIFATFVKETIEKVRLNETSESKITLIFDNATIHLTKKVEKEIKDSEWLALTLPPYTPEWNNSELAINIVKRKIDKDLKLHRQRKVSFITYRLLTERRIKSEFYKITREQCQGINRVWVRNMQNFLKEQANANLSQ